MNIQVQPNVGYIVYYGVAPEWNEFCFQQYAFDKQANVSYDHYFCGPNYAKGAMCPNCEQPLLLFLTIDTHDPRLSIANGPSHLPLVYCWSCKISDHSVKSAFQSKAAELSYGRFITRTIESSNQSEQSSGIAPFYYEVQMDGSLVVLQYGRGPGDGALYPGYPDHFPGASARLLQISDATQEVLCKINRGDPEVDELQFELPALGVPQHQIGGEPFLIQSVLERRVICPKCRSTMPLFASVGNNCLHPDGIMGDDYVQLLYYYCTTCCVVGAFNQAD